MRGDGREGGRTIKNLPFSFFGILRVNKMRGMEGNEGEMFPSVPFLPLY